MYEDDEVVVIDEETEKFARLLTLAFHDVNPKINLGSSYEAILQFLVDTVEQGVDDDDAHKMGAKIRKSASEKKKATFN